ncbi:hypothetical protein Syun_011723 [Stephania yunnanensis]|uniref:Uncharacterized protein n=1 Tax=Stephania yunnanensis TaxID=152371 RepID=A0AAP0JZA7_9MAGN
MAEAMARDRDEVRVPIKRRDRVRDPVECTDNDNDLVMHRDKDMDNSIWIGISAYLHGCMDGQTHILLYNVARTPSFSAASLFSSGLSPPCSSPSPPFLGAAFPCFDHGITIPSVSDDLESVFESPDFVPNSDASRTLMGLVGRRLLDILSKVPADDILIILSVAKKCGRACEELANHTNDTEEDRLMKRQRFEELEI